MTLIKVGSYGAGDKKRDYAEFWAWIYPHLVRAVEATFVEAGMITPTQAEVKDRCKKAKKLVEMLRLDFKWTKQRIADRLPGLLRNELLNVKHSLDAEAKRNMYTPDHASASASAPMPEITTKLESELDAAFVEGEDLAGPSQPVRAVETDV